MDNTIHINLAEIYENLRNFIAWIGLPTIVGLIVYVRSRIKGVTKGVQALLRAQMISEYNKAKDRGYAPIYAKENFENMWQNYHSLGVNGVMDGIKDEYLTMPNRKEEVDNEN